MSGDHNKIGGKSVVDEAFTGLVTKGVVGLLNSVEHRDVVQKMLRNLPPIATMIMDPVVVQTVFSAMPDFGHPEIAHLLKDVLVHSAHALEDMAHDAKSGAGDDAYIKAIKDGYGKAVDQKYAVQGRCFHRLECGEIPAPRMQASGKKGEAPKPRNDFRELSLPEAIRQRYFPCQFCIGGALEAKLPAEKPTAQAKRDPLQIIAECSVEKAKTGFEDLLKVLDPEYKKRVWTALKHLSSEAEFVGMMTVAGTLKPEEYPAFVDQLEAMLQMDEVKLAETRGLLNSIGGIVQGGGELAVDLVSSVWNAKRAPDDDTSGKSGAKRVRSTGFGIIKAFTF